MKKIYKTTGIIAVVMILLAVGTYGYFTNFGKTNIFFTGPRSPKLEMPITYNVGWWSNQDALSIDSLQIEIVESKLNLFNDKSLIAYKISGQLAHQKDWQRVIKEVHISERVNLDTTLHCDRIIELTPVVKSKESKTLDGEMERFQLRNEHTIVSNHWGINRIKFICGNKEQIIELKQRK